MLFIDLFMLFLFFRTQKMGSFSVEKYFTENHRQLFCYLFTKVNLSLRYCIAFNGRLFRHLTKWKTKKFFRFSLRKTVLMTISWWWRCRQHTNAIHSYGHWWHWVRSKWQPSKSVTFLLPPVIFRIRPKNGTRHFHNTMNWAFYLTFIKVYLPCLVFFFLQIFRAAFCMPFFGGVSSRIEVDWTSNDFLTWKSSE